ncbi:MAG: hypothetical protein ACLUKN_08590 [Bacilli bacterium]
MDQPELNPSIIGVGIDLADVVRIDSMLKIRNAFLEKLLPNAKYSTAKNALSRNALCSQIRRKRSGSQSSRHRILRRY